MRRSLAAIVLILSSTPQAFAEARMLGFGLPHRAGEFIVRFKDGVEQDRGIFRSLGVRQLRAFESSPSYLVRVDANRSSQLLESLKNNPDVESIQANRIFTIMREPNDEKFTKQYHHKKIESTGAWNVSTGSKDVVVAIIDTGVNYNHPDIIDNYWSNAGETGLDSAGKEKSLNGVDDDGNGYIDDFRGWDFVNNDNNPMDDFGHGTHCAGLIGAKGDNSAGGVGVNWNVSVVGLKFINGKTGEGDTAGAVAAIEYATKMGFPITNNSWGGPAEFSTEEGGLDVLAEAIQANAARGFLFVAASGNNRGNNDKQPILPANYEIDSILSVASSNQWDFLSLFSNYGATTVDLAAPGSGIYSTVLGSRYESMSGTSMAAPIVAGAAALLKAVHPEWDAAQIKAQLLRTVDPVESWKSKLVSGGRLNLNRALTE